MKFKRMNIGTTCKSTDANTNTCSSQNDDFETKSNSIHTLLSRIECKSQKIPLFEFGQYIILFIFFTVLTSTLLFIAHISLSPISLIAGIVLSTATMYCLGTKDPKKLVLLLLALLIIFIACVGINGVIYDFSWDGGTYHKSAVGWLELGWNPIYETTTSAIERLSIESIIPIGDVVSDVYAKATWIFAASCYSIFGNIETGKCYNLLGMLVLFCISTAFLREKANLKLWQAACCGFFLAFNPVNLAQMFSYYNDGFLGTLTLIYISCFLYLSYGDKHKYNIPVYVLIFATACIGMNVKFSGLMYFGIFGALFYFYWTFKRIKSNGFKKSFKWIRNLSIFFTILVLCSCLLFGSTSYIPNTVNHENPLYGLVGDTNIAAIDANMPVALQNTPTELRFVSSIFSESTNSKTIETPQLKIPFTFKLSEFIQSAGWDCRISGWGVLFSGIFVLGILSMIMAIIATWKKENEVAQLTMLTLAGVLIPSIFLTGMWWARYNSLPYLVQAFLLIFLFVLINKLNEWSNEIKSIKYKNGSCNAGCKYSEMKSERRSNILSKKKSMCKKVLSVCLVLAICISLVNIGPALGKSIIDLSSSIDSSNELNKLSIASEISPVIVSIYHRECNFYGRVFNLIDKNINYTLVPIIEKPDGLVFGKYGYELGVVSYCIQKLV